MSTIRPGWSQHGDVWWMDCNTGIRVAQNHVNGKFNWQVPLGDSRFMNGTGWKTIGEAMQVAEALTKMYGVIVDEPTKTCGEHAEEIAKKFPGIELERRIDIKRPEYVICIHIHRKGYKEKVLLLFKEYKDTLEADITDLLLRYKASDITVFKLSPGYPTLRICAEVRE